MPGRSVYINWSISSFFGWGVYGLNLALHWSVDPDLVPICALPISPKSLVVDPLRMRAMTAFIQRSATFQAQLIQFKGGSATVDAPVLSYFDDRFALSASAHNVGLVGRPSIAATFFETAQLTPDAIARAAAYPLVVTGSTWNTDILRAYGLTNVRLVIQGIDPTLFHPAPRLGYLSDRFLVFSGGKLERRKGQDIVVAAFRRFAESHPEALLVTAWHSPWGDAARTLDASDLTSPMTFDGTGKVDVRSWAAANGVGREQILDLGAIPNAQLPAILREMDVAVFPNRAEGGTNLVAMECMACGVPVILSNNTGHLDLIEDNNCYPLAQQAGLVGREAGFGAVAGWGESDIAEIVEQLERVWRHRAEAQERGLRGATTVGRLSWRRTAQQMKAIVLESRQG